MYIILQLYPQYRIYNASVVPKWGHQQVNLDIRKTNAVRVDLALRLARTRQMTWGRMVKGIDIWGKLACLGIFAKTPNAAKHSQLGQVTPSHAKRRVIFLMGLFPPHNIDAYRLLSFH